MNEFRTIVSVTPSSLQTTVKDAFLTVGSCFSEAMGKRLQDHKFAVAANPFGVIYNPVSIHRVLSYSADRAFPPRQTYLQNDDLFYNHDFHSSFSSPDQTSLEARITGEITRVHSSLKQTRVFIITYGTAWTWVLKAHSHIVANCHKRRSSDFQKRLLSVTDIVESFGLIHTKLMALNPEMKVILTVSPVRHIRDTLSLNQVSKSTLRLACHHICEQFDAVEYFPAYEIMMDDLRDYRFYKADMIHPTEQAEDYIWEKFILRYMSEPTRIFISKWKKIQAALRHKPFHENSSGHKNFLKDVLQKLKELESIVNVDAEIELVNARLNLSAHPKN